MADWGRFYRRLDAAHREFLSALVADWRRTGEIAELDEDAGALHFRARSALLDSPVVAAFRRTREGTAEAHLPLRTWARLMGDEQAEQWAARFEELEGADWQRTRDALVLARPGHLAPPLQQALRDLFVAFGYRLMREGPR